MANSFHSPTLVRVALTEIKSSHFKLFFLLPHFFLAQYYIFAFFLVWGRRGNYIRKNTDTDVVGEWCLLL